MDADRIRRIALADAAFEIQKLHDIHETDALRIYQGAYAKARDRILDMIVETTDHE